MEQEAEEEVEGDAEPGVVQRVEPFEGCRLEDRDEAVDGHRDDDVHGADAEGVGEGPLDVGLLEEISLQTRYCQCHLVEGSGVVVPSNSLRDVQECRDGRDQGGQVRRGQPQQVGVHHSLGSFHKVR